MWGMEHMRHLKKGESEASGWIVGLSLALATVLALAIILLTACQMPLR